MDKKAKQAAGAIGVLGVHKLWRNIRGYILPLLMIALFVDTLLKILPETSITEFKVNIIFVLAIAYIIRRKSLNSSVQKIVKGSFDYIGLTSVDRSTKQRIADRVAYEYRENESGLDASQFIMLITSLVVVIGSLILIAKSSPKEITIEEKVYQNIEQHQAKEELKRNQEEPNE